VPDVAPEACELLSVLRPLCLPLPQIHVAHDSPPVVFRPRRLYVTAASSLMRKGYREVTAQ
jgi:hypothetical protein